MPEVVFADSRDKRGDLRDYRNEGLYNAVTQVSPEVVEAWGITLPGQYGQIKNRMQEQGIHEIVGDPFHLERSRRGIPGNTVNVARLLDVIEGQNISLHRAHLALARVDFPNKDDAKKSVDGLRALIDSPETFHKTTTGKIMADCFEIWLTRHEGDLRDGKNEWGESFTVTTEITVDGMAAVKGHNEQFDKLGLPEKHAYIIKQTRDFFAHVVSL